MLKQITINPKQQILIIYIVLTLATLAVFWQVTHFDFVNFDDKVYVTENSRIQSEITLDGIRWAFITKHTSLWNPLVWLSLMLDYQLHGLNPGGYHLTNLVLHILSTLLLFWLFNRMTGAVWKSAFVAALFALHPLHVESVAWIAERKDVLSAFFWMLTLCLYVYYTEKPVIKRYLLVVFSFICALLSKPMVVTLPVIMILLDYWPLKRFESNNIESNSMEIVPGKVPLWPLWEKIPFFVLSAVIIIVTLYTPDEQGTYTKDFPLSSRLANAPVSFVTYLGKTFWPHDLAVFYPFSNQLPIWQVWGATLLIIVISAAVIVMLKRLPYLFIGWLWYAITLLPVIGIIQVGDFAMADRYHYLPSIGIAVMLAWGIPSLIKSEDIRKKILFPAAIAFLIVMSILTWQQCRYWENTIELFSHALQVTKNNYLAHTLVGSVLLEKGKIIEAIDHSNKSIRIRPNHADAYNVRGVSYAILGQYQSAINDFNKIIVMNPDYLNAYNNRAAIYAKLGQYQNSIDNLNEIIRLKPDNVAAYYNRGFAYAKIGQYQSAINDLNTAIALKQDYAEAYNNRALVYLNTGNIESGCRDARKACVLGSCTAIKSTVGRGLCR